MIFSRDYHHRWYQEINWLLKNMNQQPPPRVERMAEVSIALAILRELHESMPTGKDIITLQRITSCDEFDINALYLIMGLVPNLPYRLSLVDGAVKLLPN
jgi:hypothetical protein